MRNITMVVVHCSATPPGMDIGAKEIDRWHRETPRNWSQIGYHFVIRRDGTLETGRPLSITGAHARGYNKRSIGVCLVGGVNDEDGDSEGNFEVGQFDTLRTLLMTLHARYEGLTILGHRDLPGVTKDCPCFDVIGFCKKAGVV